MKVLIFNRSLPLVNIGGPCGYMYNISEYLKCNPTEEISFYRKVNYTIWQRICIVFENLIKKWCANNKKLKALSVLYFNYYFHHPFSKEELSYLNSFDFIHVHSVAYYLIYFFQNKSVKAKIILTSHCPQPLIDEFAGELDITEWLSRHERVRNFFIKREIKAFKDCFKIMFPVKEARAPYENSSGLYRDAFNQLNDKFFYVPTAVGQLERDETIHNYLGEYNLPHESIKLCYIGRHNSIKGYDELQRMAKSTWDIDPNINFVIGGKEGPLFRIDDSRWLELGWVKTSELLNEVDAFILPNKDTYFDLILLEVLRQGIPVILTRTGGNKWFEDKGVVGLFFYDYGNIDEFINCVLKVKSIKQDNKREEIIEANRAFFISEFNMARYVKSYCNQLQNFLN